MSLSNSVDESPLIYLVPDSNAARAAVEDPANAPFFVNKDGEDALLVYFPDPDNRRITLGRSRCDITLPDVKGAGIQRVHCYFQLSSNTGAVVLCDKSPNHTTQVYDPEEDFTIPFSRASNTVVVGRGFNRKLSIGSRKAYRFKLLWGNSDPLKNFLGRPPNHFGPEGGEYNPAEARYALGETLGHGAFGIVSKTVNLHSGKAMAVKRYINLYDRGHVMAIREINNMLKLSKNNTKQHENILPVIDVVLDKHYEWIEIFMPLMQGSVKTLILKDLKYVPDEEVAVDVLYQMAKALEYMARHNMIHRDIKPDNILYELNQTNEGIHYHYLLADFNLSSDAATAHTMAGTQLFMAPEVHRRAPQSCSTDIWSLFVTVVWIYNTDDFREFSTGNVTELEAKILTIAQDPLYENINDMVQIDSRFRVSAKTLVRRLEGSGTVPVERSIWPDMPNIEGLGISNSDDDREHEQGNYVPSVHPDIAIQFARVHGTGRVRSRTAPTAMDGHSALQDLGGVAGEDAYAGVSYRPGRVGREYAYAPQNPRTDEGYTLEEGSNDEEDEGSDTNRAEGSGRMPRYVPAHDDNE